MMNNRGNINFSNVPYNLAFKGAGAYIRIFKIFGFFILKNRAGYKKIWECYD